MLIHLLIYALGYLLTALLTARVAYGIERSRIIAQARYWHPDENPLQHFREHGQSGTLVLSFVYGMAWPLVAPVYLLCRGARLAVMARPPRSGYEERLRAKALGARIRELEESLDMGDPQPAERHGPSQVH